MLKIIKKAISGSNNTNNSSSQNNSTDNSPVQSLGYQNNALDNSGFLESQYSTPAQYGAGYNINAYNSSYNPNTMRKSGKNVQNDTGSYNLAHRNNVFNGSPVSCLPQGNINFSATSQSSPGNIHLPQNISLTKHSNQFYSQNQNHIAIKKSTTSPEFEHLEQQLKQSQQKYQDLDNQFKSQNEQIKDLKGTIQSLNDMNHKFYDEIQHLKDRNLEQRKQIESFNKLFQDCKQDSERKLSHLRQELDQSLKREMDFKKMVQQVQESKNHEISNLKDKLEKAKSMDGHHNSEMEKKNSELKVKCEKIAYLEKNLNDIQLEFTLYKETSGSEKKKIETNTDNLKKEIENLKKQIEDERKNYQEKSKIEKNEQKKHLDELEQKLEEVIKEKAEITCKYAQLLDRNKELDELIKSNNEKNEKSLKISRAEVETLKTKCINLERELTDCRDQHSKEKEEWKKFQADLQTAVRVANDFMNEAEEKYNKIKEEMLNAKNGKSIEIKEINNKLQENISNGGTIETSGKCKEGNLSPKSESTASESNHNSLNGTNGEQYEIPNYFHMNTDTDDAKLLSYNHNNGNYLFKKKNCSNSTEYSPSVVNSNFDSLSTLVKQYGVSRRNALMKWCQERLYNYDIEIKNFSSSWSDGLAFCALLHSFVPDRINYQLMCKEKDARNRLTNAFSLAESLGIEQKLNINDIVNQDRPDWNEIMNYVALIYSHFSKINDDLNKTEKKIVGKKLEMSKDKSFPKLTVELSNSK